MTERSKERKKREKLIEINKEWMNLGMKIKNDRKKKGKKVMTNNYRK